MTSRIIAVAETGSTNSDLAALAASGAEEGLWLRAERQTGGRGRLGRDWASEAGNLHISTLVRLRPADPPAHTLALVCGVAAREAAQSFLPGATVMLKWPNDLMIGTAKLAGMLLERVGDAVIAGFGCNVACAPVLPDRIATSLAEAGAPAGVDAAAMATALAERFAYWLDRWRDEGLATICTAWVAGAHPLGTPLRAVLPDDTVVTGAFDGLGQDGALLLRLADGQRRAIHAGDVFAL